MSSKRLNPDRFPRMPKALKAPRRINRMTFTRTKAKPGDYLYITMPKLGANMVLVPECTCLKFDLVVEKGVADNTVVNNVGRALVRDFVVTFGGETIANVKRYDLYEGYKDMFKTKYDPYMGILSLDERKFRTSSTGKTTDSGQVLTLTRYGNKFTIPLRHEVLDGHGVFYPKEIDDLKFQLRLADKEDIVLTSDPSKPCSYELNNLVLEYCTITDETIAREAEVQYQVGRTFLFEDVHLFETIDKIDLAKSGRITLHVNTPRRCLKGIFMVFVTETPFARDTQKFFNPQIVDGAEVSIDGIPDALYSNGIRGEDQWPLIKQMINYDMGDSRHFKVSEFFDHKFGLWIDLRTSPDNNLHGDGKVVGLSKDGVRVDFSYSGSVTSGSLIASCYVWMVSDAAVLVREGKVVQYLILPKS